MYFKVICGYECGGPEDGMMCKSYTSIIEADTAEEAERMAKEANENEPDFLGCRVQEATEQEAKEYEEQMKELEEYDKFLESIGY